MKAFVVFVPQVAASREYASKVLESIQNHAGWTPELLPGTTPDTIPLYEQWFSMQDQVPSRIVGFRERAYEIYLTKKSCFYNHVRVWHRCVELDEPVAFIEHDAICVRDWDEPKFNQVLILNARSSLKQSVIRKPLIKRGHLAKMQLDDHAVTDWQVPITNRHAEGSPVMMPGTAAYAITPKAAARLLHRVIYKGWEQSDHFINIDSSEIVYRVPDYFDLRLPNLQLSHGLPNS